MGQTTGEVKIQRCGARLFGSEAPTFAAQRFPPKQEYASQSVPGVLSYSVFVFAPGSLLFNNLICPL
jgi:hypothetical protein